MKRLVLVVVAAIATVVAPLAVAGASSHKTILKTVSLSGSQSVSVTCSGKSLSVTKSGNVAVLVCASRTVKASVKAPPATTPPATTPPVTTPALTQQQKSAVASAKEYLATEAFSQQWASTGLTDIQHQGHRPREDVQNGDHGEEEAASASLVHSGVQS